MELAESTVNILGGTTVSLIILWALGAIFHQMFIPKIEEGTLKQIAEFITRRSGFVSDPSHRLPDIIYLSTEELLDLVPEEEQWRYLEGEGWGLWFDGWNRIALNENWNRIDNLAHEVTHWVQSRYRKAVLLEGEKENDAWHMARIVLQAYCPLRYGILIILYGWAGIWGFEIFKDPLFKRQ